MPSDLLSAKDQIYDASSIEVLEPLEAVRLRPGMYIGGIDERAYHHLAAEIIDNSMDEAVAGHANRIEVTLEEGNRLTIVDNGRGIPVDEHPKYPGKSALEVILTTLHSGGKFSGKAYATSGGLHGVGVSVVNALSSLTRIEVARNKELYAQEFSRGLPTTKLLKVGNAPNRRAAQLESARRPKRTARSTRALMRSMGASSTSSRRRSAGYCASKVPSAGAMCRAKPTVADRRNSPLGASRAAASSARACSAAAHMAAHWAW